MFRFPSVLKLVILLIGCIGLFNVFRNSSVRFSRKHQQSIALTTKSQDISLQTPSHQPKERNRSHTKLVLLTYMRSGSTFTGDIIQRSPDVFYVFEPLWSVDHLLRDPDLNSTHGNKSASYIKHLKTNTIENFMTCNMKNIDVYTFVQKHMKFSLSTRPFHDCILQKHHVFGIQDCLPLLERACRESRVSCVKTIRFSMKKMEHLMEKYPEMKVLHLVRDPRPTLLSQWTVGEFEWANLNTSAIKLCNVIETDLQDSVYLRGKFPERVFILRYEDLAEYPQNMAEQIYALLDIDLTDDIRKYIHNITSSTVETGDAMTINRNSKAIIFKWRKVLPFEYVPLIDKICGTVYREMGYLPLKEEANLLNPSIRTYVDVPGGKYLQPKK